MKLTLKLAVLTEVGQLEDDVEHLRLLVFQWLHYFSILITFYIWPIILTILIGQQRRSAAKGSGTHTTVPHG